MIHVISHHDAGWVEFDRDPQIDPKTGLPYNLVETPPAFIIETSRLSPDFNQRQHPYCGLLSSMHSWSCIWAIRPVQACPAGQDRGCADRVLADKMLNGELERQKRLKAELADRSGCAQLAWKSARCCQNSPGASVHRYLALYCFRSHHPQRTDRDRVSRTLPAFSRSTTQPPDSAAGQEHELTLVRRFPFGGRGRRIAHSAAGRVGASDGVRRRSSGRLPRGNCRRSGSAFRLIRLRWRDGDRYPGRLIGT